VAPGEAAAGRRGPVERPALFGGAAALAGVSTCRQRRAAGGGPGVVGRLSAEMSPNPTATLPSDGGAFGDALRPITVVCFLSRQPGEPERLRLDPEPMAWREPV